MNQKDQERLEWLASELMCAKCERYVTIRGDAEFVAGDVCDSCAQNERPMLLSENAALRTQLDAMLGKSVDEPLRQDELEMSRDEMLRRYRNQKGWFQSWASCLDGLEVRGLDKARMPNDVRMIVEMLLSANARLAEENKRLKGAWVSVEDALPELSDGDWGASKTVWFVSNGKVHLGDRTALGWWTRDGMAKCATHWMPYRIPEPPKE